MHGLIFLFKWRPGDEPSGSVVNDDRLDSIFFAQQVGSLSIFVRLYKIIFQVIQNACATQAIVNLLLNSEHPDIKLGSILSDFRAFTTGFDPAVSFNRMFFGVRAFLDNVRDVIFKRKYDLIGSNNLHL